MTKSKEYIPESTDDEQEQIGKESSITRERVRRIEDTVLRELRTKRRYRKKLADYLDEGLKDKNGEKSVKDTTDNSDGDR